jgi:peroxiredoxin
MKTKFANGLCLLAVALFSADLNAADETSPDDPGGLPVGQRAPAFTLKDQSGKDVSLETLLKKGPVAVVFYRSADWCIYCKLQLIQMQRNLKKIEACGGQVVGISYDSLETVKKFADRQKITFPLLSDTGSKIIDAYDMHSPDATAEYAGISRHGTFILDQKGVVRAKFSVLSYEDDPAISALVKALKDAQNPDGGTKP